MITAVDGKEVTDMSSLRKILLSYSVGDKATITVYRDGKKKNLDLEFNIDTSNVDEYNKAKPSSKDESTNEDIDEGFSNPFFNLP